MRKTCGLLFLSVSAFAGEYGFSDYYFVDPDRAIHVEGRYRQIAPAKFRNPAYGHLKYSDAYGSLVYTFFANEDNSISLEGAYSYLGLDWEKNPRFRQKNFNYAVGSIGYVSTSVERWRWIFNAGFSVDSSNFNFGQTGVYHGMMWGRYNFNQCCGFHIGVLGWYGVENGRTLPIFGVDWRMSEHWSTNIIYPCDFSLTYHFDDQWSVSGNYSGFGGPYRYPRRAYEGTFRTKKGAPVHDPIFMVYSPGGDLNLNYQYNHLLRASIGGGWNGGGWIQIRDSKDHFAKYYHYHSAFYAQGHLAFTF